MLHYELFQYTKGLFWVSPRTPNIKEISSENTPSKNI